MFIDVDPAIAAYIVFVSLLLSSPLWVPVAFFAYAVGRRQYSLQALFAFFILEAVSLAVAVTTFALNTVAKE
jgi:hypothetical protein